MLCFAYEGLGFLPNCSNRSGGKPLWHNSDEGCCTRGLVWTDPISAPCRVRGCGTHLVLTRHPFHCEFNNGIQARPVHDTSSHFNTGLWRAPCAEPRPLPRRFWQRWRGVCSRRGGSYLCCDARCFVRPQRGVQACSSHACRSLLHRRRHLKGAWFSWVGATRQRYGISERV